MSVSRISDPYKSVLIRAHLWANVAYHSLPSLDDAKIQLPAIKVHARHLHSDSVAEPVPPFRPAALQRVRKFIEVVIIVHEGTDVDQPFYGELLSLGEEAIVGHASNNGRHLFADSFAHIGQQFYFDEFALGSISPALSMATMLAHCRQFYLI